MTTTIMVLAELRPDHHCNFGHETKGSLSYGQSLAKA